MSLKSIRLRTLPQLFVLLVLTGLGCDEGAEPRSAVEVRRSTLAPAIVFSHEISGFERTFSDGARFDVGPNGRLAVLDRMSTKVQVYDSAGSFDFEFGRFGQGPGEFRSPQDVAFAPDGQILVLDEGNRRLSLWGPGKTLISESSIPNPRTHRIVQSNSLIATKFWEGSPDSALVTVVVYAETGGRLQPARQWAVTWRALDQREFCVVCEFHLLSDSVFLTQESDTSLALVGIGSTGDTSVSWSTGRPLPMHSRASLTAFLQTERQELTSRLGAIAERLPPLDRIPDDEELVPMRPFPRTGGYAIDSSRRTWMMPAVPSGQASVLDVFADDGQKLTTIELPVIASSFRLMGQWLVVRTIDDFDLPRFLVYRVSEIGTH